MNHNQANQPKLVAVDIDETLSNFFNIISWANKKALRKLVDNNHFLALVTGRSWHHALSAYRKVFKQPRKNTFLISCNGAKVVQMRDNKVLFEKAFTLEETLWMHKVSTDLNLVTFHYINANLKVGYTNRKYSFFSWWLRTINKYKSLQVDLVDQAKIRPAAKFEVAGNDIRIKHLVKVINQEVCNNNFSYHMFSRKENFHEFVPASVSKEQSLRFLANHLNLSTRNLVAIGNGNNDIGMLKMANPGVAVANASLKVKASAQYVTSTWYRNGVKKMLEKEHLV